MSLVFNDTTTNRGIIQEIESNIKMEGRISSNTSLLKQFTAKINLAFDSLLSMIFQSNGKWQFDDSNHTDYPIITTNLVAGQRDYSFTTDEQGNLILDIYKVMIKDENGYYNEIYPVDVQSENNTQAFYDGREIQGVPFRYDKTSNGIFLDSIPSYNSTGGLKIYVNREASYFVYTDTTKKPGFAGLFHRYLAIEPSYQYAMVNGLKNVNFLKSELDKMEKMIKKHYRDRSRDEISKLSGEIINSV